MNMRELCEYFLILKCLLLWLNTSQVSNVLIEKPDYKNFQIYWNIPTFQCRPHKIFFTNLAEKYNIIQNADDSFRGSRISILYDPGDFPAILEEAETGKLFYRNGGVPQQGNLTLHLDIFQQVVNDLIPDENFTGIGIIDFESWRPIFRQNFGTLQPYKDLSYKLEQTKHPAWPKHWIDREARKNFEMYGRYFMEETLYLAKLMRPYATWGYYAYPYCFNMAPNNMYTNCPPEVVTENDRIMWLFSASTGYYPSIYLSQNRLSSMQMVQLIEGRVQESQRIISQLNKVLIKPKVLPYMWLKYQDTKAYMTKTHFCDMENGKLETTLPIAEKPRRERVRVGDPDFEPPDGGWGWLIVFACGFSNLSTFPMLQQYGLIFREKFEILGLSNAQTTTVVNLNSTFTACAGLLNGPIFRRFSYRQVAIFGTCMVSLTLFLTSYSQSFWWYIILYSFGYGTTLGIAQAANALALNTYFKTKRRIATGLSWTTTAFGPVMWPYIITFLLGIYGMEWTLAIFAAFAGNSIASSLLLQPVHWHTKYREDEAGKALVNGKIETDCPIKSASRSIFSSQYLFNEDDRYSAGYEIVDPGTPMMIRANDGWYSQKSSLVGSRISLSSNKGNKSRITSGQNSVVISKRPSYNNLLDARKKRSSQSRPIIQEHVAEDCPFEKAPQDLRDEEKLLLSGKKSDVMVYPNEKDVLKTAAKRLAEYKEIKAMEVRMNEVEKMKEKGEEVEENFSFLQKFIIFFDLNLLKDYIYVNLMLGITLANFVELNFSVLTPFVLKEFKFHDYEIAMFMSLLGATDIVARFFIPFLAERIGWENKTFFLFGVLNMALGRVILVHTQTYKVSLLVAVIIGFGKGLRTVFMALVIPSHVPLERLPAASGLQLATSGLLFLIMGPIVGWIRDAVNNYVITLHILNILTYVTALSWTMEKIITSRKRKREERVNNFKLP